MTSIIDWQLDSNCRKVGGLGADHHILMEKYTEIQHTYN